MERASRPSTTRIMGRYQCQLASFYRVSISIALGTISVESAALECSCDGRNAISCKSLDRPQLAECLRSLRQGDTLIVWRLDCLGRSVKDLVALINELRERGVEFVSVTEA